MAAPKTIGCLVAVAATLGLTACKDDKSKKAPLAPAVTPAQRCEQLAKACGSEEKHVPLIREKCIEAAAAKVDKACTEKVFLAYDCYERELCGKSDKVWSFEDLGVLAGRHEKCAAEHAAARDCGGK